jgi:hypothetical protein
MKRYTGQKALYEAINRSRAKAKRGSILERLRPETPAQEKPAGSQEQTPAEPMKAPAERPRPVVKEPSRPLLEKLKEAVIIKESAKLKRLATVIKKDMPAEKPVPAAVTTRSAEKADRPAPRPSAVPKWWRLKPVQLNAGRVEVSVPYHIGVVAILAVILVVLAAFRVGQRFSGLRTPAPAAAQARAGGQNVAAAQPTQDTTSAAGESTRREGDHWIVLAQHKNAADLEEVAKYFGSHGVELSVWELGYIRNFFRENGLNAANLPAGDGYLLTTRYLYSNPNRPGDGHDILQKIIELGRGYRAPPGRDTFAATHFSDAYGMKISKLAQ